jgi:ADP-heptose:LPS heptosyltransferase
VHRLASSWTPNKDWPTNYWENLVLSLSKTCSVIEIGRLGPDRRISNLPNYIDLRGAMDIRELVACVKAADILVSSDSGPVHIAAAVRTPAVVIFGGYIIPKNIDYQGNTILYSPMHCSPCLLRIPCPINMECLRRIQPDAVEQAITLAWDKWKQDQID